MSRPAPLIKCGLILSIAMLPLAAVAAEPEKPRVVELFEDETDATIKALTNDGNGDPGTATREDKDCFSGRSAIRVTPSQRYNSRFKGWNYPIVEKPQDGQYRYIRFAWKKIGGIGIMMQLCGANDPTTWDHRYVAGRNAVGWTALNFTTDMPVKWELVTRDLFKDFGGFTLTGIAFTPMDGTAGLYDHIYLGKTIADLDNVTDAVLGKTPIKDKPTAEQLGKCWDDLTRHDAVITAPAARTMIAAQGDAIAFFKERFKARDVSEQEKKILKLITELDDDDFGVREAASTELQRIGDKADPFLKKTLAETKSLEVQRRIEALLGNRATGEELTSDQLRQLRAVRVLEQIGSDDARDLLDIIAKDPLSASVGSEAKIALERLKKR